jgi:Asp-tRNA(Asn)/Glu-tRNA(Gln) amidotransferase A subunit family amidase
MMLSPDRMPEPRARPFLGATAQFAGGQDTPRAFLERCIEASVTWEPKIGAFVHTNLDGARAAADASDRRWRDNKPLSAIDGMSVGIK